MKTIILHNVISENELHFMYSHIINNTGWKISGEATRQKGFIYGPKLIVKEMDQNPEHYPFFIWGQTVVHRIEKLLQDKHIGIPTSLERMNFNATNHGKKIEHWLHADTDESKYKAILLFLTPIWQPDWRGSFYVDGEEFNFKPGSAVIYDANEYHQGESPISETYNWQRLTCNILVKE